VLDGAKPWCSLAADLSHAIITAHTGPTTRRAFAISLGEGVSPLPGTWVSRGLVDVPSGGLRLDGVVAVPVGDDDWYLSRPGFAWGGIAVAAVWFGAAQALRAGLVSTARRREPDQIALMHVGHLDALLFAAETALRHAAEAIDSGAAAGSEGAVLAARVRAVVAAAAETCLVVVGHALGPAPLTADEEHARRVADLTVYVRQHHAERDLAALGSMVVGTGSQA
jgi:alkylation response protein AidB-like acyl-CoA dehydrogenase